MTYNGFAYVYDDLMKDTPYDQWVEFVLRQTNKYQVQANRILDLACGTGEFSIWLAEAGYNVTGVDLSLDMLAVANAKASERGLPIAFYQQDMTELEGFEPFDVVTIFCDSLNYLQTSEQVKRTFERVALHLQPDGIFMFDVHSLFKMNDIFLSEGPFVLNEDDISYIWQCFPGETPNSVEHELSFFVLDGKSGHYERIDEIHMQRTYPFEQYVEWLEESGFELLNIGADFTDETPKEDSERIFFTARKR
ncbi:class I SAM-dependent methyltransferase [Bacillus sp. DNRA2]|uniref:class I SAM-dependent DNA methyltransferase n=1 Tax=Bacillus sp. DNRA2 TaxID=2723053 RepID=UPI00145E2F82|nr:class I SAM-dependent methyltransferase [Bacillus sp. DNRA2]NMD70632.1 class I SAM-dependent methyltransferase [Bacillus sp. DNRA2]